MEETMKCYKCGCTLGEGRKCPQCGADVSVYKKAAKASNAYYNLGLAKAGTRDLSGAIESLRTSIAINKNNIDARNLLGLVYCEMGDVVEALTQWVISKNLQPEDNVASSYITDIQSNQAKFEMITGTIKKYNLSLRYAKEGNYDMAIIQLKKIVTQNPQLLRAQLLLSLLYLKDNETARAKKHLLAVLHTDRNNTLANRYMQDIEEEILSRKKESQTSFLPKKKVRDIESRPLNGNDVIMPRSSYKEPSNGAITIINILVGVLIGAALIWFLIMPSRNKGIIADYNKSIQEYSEQLSSGNVELNSLNTQLNEVKKEKEALQEQLSSLSGKDGSNKLLSSVISAANYYISNDMTKTALALADVDVSALPTDEAKSLYSTLSNATSVNAAKDLFNQGMTAYNKSTFDTAAELFVNAYKCDKTRADAAFYAAKCYVALSQTDNAKKYYQYIVDEFKTSSYYQEANSYVTSH
jgi:tetratricopeptide (TPR) repeat protein